MSNLVFQPFQDGLDPKETLMVDGYTDGYRTLSHWPGHSTPGPLRHDLTTGSALILAGMSPEERQGLLGDYSIVTNNHIDADGVLSAFCVLNPELALEHQDLILRTAATGDMANWSGPDALALELTLMSEVAQFEPFYGAPMTEQHLKNLTKAYEHCFELLKDTLLDDPFALQNGWQERHDQVVADIARVEAGEGIKVTQYPEEDLAVLEIDRQTTLFGLRHAAGDLFRVLVVVPSNGGWKYRFFYRAESWFDVTSIKPHPRKKLDGLAARFNELEQNADHQWWSTPTTWVVPELGFGAPTRDDLQASAADPEMDQDPPSQLRPDVVVKEVRAALTTVPAYSDFHTIRRN